MRLLGVASREYAARAADAQTKVTHGSVAAIAVLLGAFALFFLRSVAAHTTAERLAARTRACSQRARSRR